MRYCPGDRKPHSSIVTLRATWTIQASLGCGVIPAIWTCRLPRWMEEDVIGHEPAQRPDLGREKVGRDQHVQMRPDKLLPRGGRLALWRRWDTVALENVAHGLVTDRIAQVGQCPHDAIVAPRAIFLRQAHHQG